MIWARLKSMKCPKCNAVLMENAETFFVQCSACSFKISKEKFNSIVADLYKPKNYEIIGDNAYELNNLDMHKTKDNNDDLI